MGKPLLIKNAPVVFPNLVESFTLTAHKAPVNYRILYGNESL